MVFNFTATKGREMKIDRPRYFSTDLAAALRHDWRGWHFSQKMDGVFSVRTFGDSTLTGETMPDKSFHAFDIVTAYGEDVRRRQWRERREAMLQIAREAGVATVAEGHGSEFIEAIIARGFEGVVAKSFDAYFGVGLFKIKKTVTYDVTVTAKLQGAVAIAYEGQDSGKCALSGWKFDAVRVGDVVEISCFARLASGKFRSPVFLRFRHDKNLIQPKARPV